MKKLIVCLVLVGLLLVGCAETPTTNVFGTKVCLTPDTEKLSIGVGGEQYSLKPNKLYANMATPGTEIYFPLTLLNESSEAVEFLISVRTPDFCEEGYEKLPEQYYSWVTFDEHAHVVGPNQEKTTPVTITIRKSITKSEVWISASQKNPTGFVQVELCTRILLSVVGQTLE